MPLDIPTPPASTIFTPISAPAESVSLLGMKHKQW
jgi:hypothetical protein